MSFTQEAYFRATASGLSFSRSGGPFEDDDHHCELRVEFRSLAWYPEERDTGQGADFDAEIASIEMRDLRDTGKNVWHTLAGADRKAAEALLETHHHRAMWDQAESDVYEELGQRRWAA